jgi:hypothetical protein
LRVMIWWWTSMAILGCIDILPFLKEGDSYRSG